VFQLSELHLQIKKVEKEVFELKKLDISDRMLLQKSLKTQRNVNNLENRLGVVSACSRTGQCFKKVCTRPAK
jgi:hypothetical protein